MLSSEATGKCSKFRFLETGRQGGIFELYKYKETCTGSDSKDRVSEHEVHKPTIHDEGLPFHAKEVGNYSKVLNICTWSIKDQCVDMGNVHVFVNESSQSSWTIFFGESGESSRARTSWKFRVYSIPYRNWYWSILKRFWMCIRLKAHLPHGRDRHCLMVKCTKPKVRENSDSELCLGKMYDDRDGITRWEGQVEEFKMSASYKELLGIDGEPIEFEWNILPRFSSLQLLQKIQNDVRERNIEPEKFTDRIIFISMFNDIDWTRKRNDGICISNSEKVKAYEKRFSRGHWTFLGPGHEKKW